ncbi:MAG: glycoside hydrolase family 127 protein [Clostridia bacterium]|nr:glycoside hydrolase family 127 protein [Clostridia bacterium]
MKKLNFIPFSRVTLGDGFWQDRYNLNKHTSVENVRARFEESGRFDALRFNYLKTGKKPHYFFDSDAAKWIEAVAYLAQKDPDAMRPHLALCEELIDCMERAQRPDGYLNSELQQISPELIFKKRWRHELYCAGHLIEAAVAYHETTGKNKFLRIMERYCDCIERAFITEKTAEFVTPGHEEIELALYKLYRHTGNEKYKKMAEFFLESRALHDEEMVYKSETEINRYGTQDDVDIRHLKDANGHCVRAVYLYTGIADMALENGDRGLFENLDSVFDDIYTRKMYITGGIGSTRNTESFTVPYDLPNHTAYAESCCAIALMRFGARMRALAKNAKYGHMMERVLYNNMLSSTSLDGKSFFYENPLEIALEEHGREVSVIPSRRERLPITQRVEVFSCSCCPPNINRFFGELGSYIFAEDTDGVCVEQYVSASVKTDFGSLCVKTQYALDGLAEITSNDYRAKVFSVRLPEWSRKLTAILDGHATTPEIRDGYAYFAVGASFTLSLDFHITPSFVSANPLVRANAGRVALTYGPTVYCLEGADNGDRLNGICIDPSQKTLDATQKALDFHKLYSFTLPAWRESPDTRLYFDAAESARTPVSAKFIPYFAFANRGESDMLVWVRKA